MPDTKISALTTDDTPAGTDVVPTVKDPTGTPLNRKLSLTALLTYIAGALGFTLAPNKLTVPTVIGGTGTSDDLHLVATSGVGGVNARVFIDGGSNGAVSLVEFKLDAALSNGMVGIGTAAVGRAVSCPLTIYGVGADIGYLISATAHPSNASAYTQMATGAGATNDQAGFSFYQQANAIEWRMAVIGNGGNCLRFTAINSGGGSYTNHTMWMTPASMNLLLASTQAKDVTTGTRCLVLEVGTAPTDCAADTAALFSQDVNSSAELFAMNEAGQAVQLTAPLQAITATFDGGGAVLTAKTVYVPVPYACTITGWRIVADVAGSAVVDVWKDTYANYPPVVGDSIAGSEKPTLSSVIKNEDTTLSTWTDLTVDVGDYLAFALESGATVVTWLCVQLLVRRGT